VENLYFRTGVSGPPNLVNPGKKRIRETGMVAQRAAIFRFLFAIVKRKNSVAETQAAALAIIHNCLN